MPYQHNKGPHEKSQRDAIRPQMFRDQFGRRWHCGVEKKTGHPSGPLVPQFWSPLAVPSNYIELSQDEERPYDIAINFKRWKADHRLDQREWESEGRKRSRKLYAEQYDARKAFTLEVLDIIGPGPGHIEPIIAYEQGNKWMLGATAVPDQRLLQFFTPEELDPDRVYDEPDFRDYEPAASDRLHASVRETEDERLAREEEESLREIADGEDRRFSSRMTQEEEADPDALGGHRVKVGKPQPGQKRDAAQKSMTPSAVRKRAARERQRQDRQQLATV